MPKFEDKPPFNDVAQAKKPRTGELMSASVSKEDLEEYRRLSLVKRRNEGQDAAYKWLREKIVRAGVSDDDVFRDDTSWTEDLDLRGLLADVQLFFNDESALKKLYPGMEVAKMSYTDRLMRLPDGKLVHVSIINEYSSGGPNKAKYIDSATAMRWLDEQAAVIEGRIEDLNKQAKSLDEGRKLLVADRQR